MIAYAVVNWGRWIARCPRDLCTNAMRLEYGQAVFQCRDGCGLACGLVWPPNWPDIEGLLCDRPVPATRNWELGETLHDLLAENVTYGVFSDDLVAELDARGGGVVYAIAGDRVAADAAAALGASRRIAVGAG